MAIRTPSRPSAGRPAARTPADIEDPLRLLERTCAHLLWPAERAFMDRAGEIYDAETREFLLSCQGPLPPTAEATVEMTIAYARGRQRFCAAAALDVGFPPVRTEGRA